MGELIAGYGEALERQEGLRDSAFLDLPLLLCGFPCVNMTARHFAILIHSRSPFVCGGFPLPENVAQFLWVLHPRFSYTEKVERDAFIACCAELDYEAAVKEITQYVDDCFMDSPATGAKSGESFNSWIASLVDTLAREYGWAEQAILSLPMSALFQYVRVIVSRNDSKTPQFNKLTDAAKNRWWESVNAAKPGTN